MATNTARKTAAPRKRTPSKATAAAATDTAVETAANEVQKVQFDLVQGDDTKTYSRFTPPADSGCVGTLYVPHGTERVVVLLIGPA